MNIKPLSSRAEFERKLLTFLNQVLPSLDRRGRLYPSIEPSTLLFETGIVDSLSILHLIAFLEDQIGRSIPDQMILPPNFKSPDAIVQAFWPTPSDENRAY
jgi:acyl carrier protein